MVMLANGNRNGNDSSVEIEIIIFDDDHLVCMCGDRDLQVRLTKN